MNKENIYILQIDLPDGSVKGDEYKPNGILYCNKRFNDSKSLAIKDSEDIMWFKWQVENNEKFFKLKEEETTRTYTEKEYLQFGEECFKAARESDYNPPYWYANYKCKSFSDYMNSIKK